MRKVGVVTVARSDYSIYLPVLKRLRQDPDVTLVLIAGGMHLSLEFGLTADLIEADGFSIDHRVEMLQPSDAPEGIAHSMGLGTMGFAQAYADSSPDLLLLLGDRFEMHSAAVAALPFNIPIAHIHGGEVTEGAMDDALRHSITKMSHLHFVSNDDARRRVMQLGEEAWRITVSGAPGIDNLRGAELMDKTEMGALLDFDLKSQPLLVTYHPVTLENDDVRPQVENLLAALIDSGRQMIFTMSNADTNGRFIMGMINEFTKTCADAHVVKNLGTQGYYSLMSLAGAMVGNSSSGIIEAPSFGLPVVNIGSRQGGRTRGKNVIDVGYERGEITEGIEKALSTEFRAGLEGEINPYGDGHASESIVKVLKEIPLDQRLIKKRFVDLPTRSFQTA